MRFAHKAVTSVAAVGALLLLGAPVASSDTNGTTGSTETYLILAKQQAVSADTTARVSAAEQPGSSDLSRDRRPRGALGAERLPRRHDQGQQGRVGQPDLEVQDAHRRHRVVDPGDVTRG